MKVYKGPLRGPSLVDFHCKTDWLFLKSFVQPDSLICFSQPLFTIPGTIFFDLCMQDDNDSDDQAGVSELYEIAYKMGACCGVQLSSSPLLRSSRDIKPGMIMFSSFAILLNSSCTCTLEIVLL